MKRILIVDDEVFIHKLIRSLLERESQCTIYTATNADDGKDILKEHEVDLIFLDINMSGTNSLAFVRELRDGEATKTIPIIIISSMSFEEIRESYQASGINSFFSKTSLVDPQKQAILLDTIRTYLAN